MSIDKIFLKQFKANNKFIDAMLSIINNYLQISDMKKLLSCCQLICDSKDMFEENNKILNELQEKMDIFKSQLDKLEVKNYCLDSRRMFTLLYTYSNQQILLWYGQYIMSLMLQISIQLLPQFSSYSL